MLWFDDIRENIKRKEQCMKALEHLDSLNNPLLEDMRNWIQNRSLRITGIGRKVLRTNGSFGYETFTHMEHADAKFLLTGLEIVETLYNNPREEHISAAYEIFTKSSAPFGWESRVLPSGRYMIVRISDEIVVNKEPMVIQSYEAESINTICKLTNHFFNVN